ncbi:MAG: ABC transporter permease [Lachnospiraceae bacterium]|nr:ABC transporter permease [Lachnospiraceae bacterium]
MLFKLSFRNIRRSLQDYAIYFFTLIIGVSVFYVFNAIGGQAAMLEVARSRKDIIELLTTMLSGVSVFVAGVLGLLIVYASRFLMKRRNKEFALYLMLGMSKRSISAILLLEMIVIGFGSLLVGLLIGIGLSQLMSAFVANLFEADMTAYRFLVSGEAIMKTVLYFAVMYLVVIVFNSVVITKMKLIDLIQSERKSEHVRLKNPSICVILFLIAVAALGYAYYQVGWQFNDLNNKKIIVYIAMGAASTFLIFWAVSGMLLRVVMSMKRAYYRNINAFTFRQISSKVNTTVVSMTVICLMLFVTICTLAAAFSIRNSMNANLKMLCPADFEIEYREYTDEEMTGPVYGDVTKLYADYGHDLTEGFSDYVHFHSYSDENFTLGTFLGNQLDAIMERYRFLMYDMPFQIYRISDYNALMQLYGRETLTLDENEFILLCDFKTAKTVLDSVLTKGYTINVMGRELHSRLDDCQDGFVDISSQHINTGIFIFPDNAVNDTYVNRDYMIGNYTGNTKEALAQVEKDVRETTEEVIEQYRAENENKADYNRISLNLNTKTDISEATIGLGAMVTFLGLYIGLIFLIACGAILALKELSESVDSISRYEMLRKIGVEEKDISKSLFRQTGLFFMLPLILACIHAVFGMKFAVQFLEVFGTEKIGESIAFTSVILLLIYGGYFLITYISGKNIIKERK